MDGITLTFSWNIFLLPYQCCRLQCQVIGEYVQSPLRGCLHNLSPNTWISHRPKWPKLPRIEIAGFLNRTRRIFMWLNTDGPWSLHKRPTSRDMVWDLSIMNKPISSATGPCTKNFRMTVTICYWDSQARKLQRFATFNRIWWHLESFYLNGQGKTRTYL